MLESLVGLMMPATRHAAVSMGTVAPGGVKAPAGTLAATEMVVSGRCKDASPSQGIGAANAPEVTTAANGIVASKAFLDFMLPPVDGGAGSLAPTGRTDCPCADNARARKPDACAARRQHLPYRTDELALVVHADHPLARHRKLPFDQTLEYEFVGLPPATAVHTMLHRAAARAGRTMSYRVVVSSFDAALRVVAAGLGIGVIPRQVTRGFNEQHGIKVIALTERPPKWPTTRCASRAQSTRDAVQKCIKQAGLKSEDFVFPSRIHSPTKANAAGLCGHLHPLAQALVERRRRHEASEQTDRCGVTTCRVPQAAASRRWRR